MTKDKKHNLTLIVLSILLGLGTLVVLANYCSLVSCEDRFTYLAITDGLLAPITSGLLTLSASLVLLLFFPSTIFKLWLRYIASWYVPLSILLVLSIPRSGGGILMPDRGVFAIQLMSILFVITAVYAVVQYWRGR